MVRDAARRVPATPRPSSTATGASTSPTLRDAGRRRGARAARVAASSRATGSRSGRRTRSSGSSPRSASRPRAACSCRSTPASRAPRRRTSSRAAARGRSSPCAGSSTPTTRRCSPSAGVELPALEHTILLAGEPDDGVDRLGRLRRARRRAVADADLDARVASIGADDPSDVVFTSGTTGSPKGVVMTHGQTLRAYLDWCDWADLRAGDRYLIVNPFFHIFGYKAGCLACLMRGATIFPLAVFDAGRGARDRRARADHGAARAADDLPLAARPSRPHDAATSRACASA